MFNEHILDQRLREWEENPLICLSLKLWDWVVEEAMPLTV